MELTSGTTYSPVKITLLLLGFILIAFVGWSIAAKWYVLPARMNDLLLEAPEADVPMRMDYILRNSSAPYADLANWMGSDRAVIALEATQRLNQQIDRWELQPGIAIAPHATALVAALEIELPNYDEKVRQEVNQIARRMSRWELGPSERQHGKFLLALEAILRSTAMDQPRNAPAASEAMLSRYVAQTETSEASLTQSPSPFQVNQVKLNGGLPWNQASVPNRPDLSTSQPKPTEPVIQKESEVLPTNRRVTLTEPLKLPQMVAAPKQISPGLHYPEVLPDLSHLTTLEIMWKLHSQNSQMVQHAREALLARNFSSGDLELASRLSHPDVALRLQLVRDLTLMPREDRKDWLYMMTKDPDDEVRYGATSALLTSSDPRLLRRLKADMATDPSPRIQTLIHR